MDFKNHLCVLNRDSPHATGADNSMPGLLQRTAVARSGPLPSQRVTTPGALMPGINSHPPTPESIFERIQSREQLSNYSVGGTIEGVGKFLQRTDRWRYFEHPVAAPLFTPVQALAKWGARLYLGPDVSNEEMDLFLNKIIGGAGIYVGNFIKVASNLIAMKQFRKLAQNSNNAKIIKKASEGNSARNICYLTEKCTLGASALLYKFGFEQAAVASLLVSQTATIILAPVTIKGNWGIIKTFSTNLKSARDACKILCLNVTKGIWASSTLGLFGLIHLAPESVKQNVLSDTLLKQISDALGTGGSYNFLMQNSWELPSAAIVIGAILTVTPPAIALAINTTGVIQAGKIAKAKPEVTPEISNKMRLDSAMGAAADVFNMIGGYYTASLLWQPLGAMFNGVGSLISFVQSRYKARHHLA